MYKTKGPEGRLNLCGLKITKLRMAMRPRFSQKAFAGKLQLLGLEVRTVH